MTLDKFLNELSKTSGWNLTHEGAIRTKDGHCPLSYVADVSKCAVLVSADKLKLKYDDAFAVSASSDAPNNYFNPNDEDYDVDVRKKLLEACHLTEVDWMI